MKKDRKHFFALKKSVRAAVWLCGALLIALCLPLAGHAQDTGYISGTVTDKTGAVVGGADVIVSLSNGSLVRTTETNGDGVYVVAGLPGGTYDVVVTAKGFQKFEAKNVVLAVAQKARVDVALSVGAVSEEVVVTGENVAQVETQSSELSSTITGRQVNELELNGRNFTQLITLAPGVINQTGQDEGTVGIMGNTQYSINGGRTEYNNWEIDGGDNMDNGSNSTLNVYPNLEAISEFKVLTSNYGAQYGKNGSGTVEVEIKSGTPEFHGSAFYYGRNDFFNANSWADSGQGVPRPAYKKHDFGYTLGGPLYIPHLYNNDKKKTFFFWSEEWRREKTPGTLIAQNVPSDAERTGNFNDVCPVYTGAAFTPASFPDCPFQPNSQTSGGTVTPFVNNTVPTPFSSTANAMLALIPKANGTLGQYATGQAAGNNLPAYIANPSYPTHWREELIRVDHNLTANERLAFHYIHDSWGTVVQGPLWGQYSNTFDNTNTDFLGPTTSFVARLTSTISPSLLNEFVASYTDDHIFLTDIGNVALPSGGVDLVPLFANGLEGKVPAFSVGNTNNGVVYGSGGFSVDTGYFPWKNANPTYTYRDILTKIIGSHTLFFGGYFVAAQKNQESSVDPQGQLSFFTSNPNSSGNPFADLLLAQVGTYTQDERKLYYYDRYKIFEPFFQDDWRITRKLTLNLGLRWSLYGRYQELHDQEFGFSVKSWSATAAPAFFNFTSANSQLLNITPGTSLFNGLTQCGASSPAVPGVSPGTTGCMRNKWINPGPRLGFAYDPLGNGKWAIRGGYGIFFEHMNGNEANAEVLQSSASPLAANGSVSSVTGYAGVGGSAGPAGPPSPLSVTSIPDQVQWPYMQQWNLGVEHELPKNVLLSVAYVGSKGTHLSRQFDLNQLLPVQAADNPFLATGTPIDPGGADCANFANPDSRGLPTQATLGNGTVVTGQAVANLFIACGNPAANYYRTFQGFGTITRIENTANSIYNALQTSVRRTVGDLTFSLSYTYSHSIDDSSDRYDVLFTNPADPSRSRASSNFDIRHALSLSYVYGLPIFKNEGLLHTLLGGWQVSGITTALSGPPFTVTNGTTYSDNAGVANGLSGGVLSFPNVVGNANQVPASTQQAYAAANVFGVLDYNPGAFALPVGLTFGTATRNEFRMPGRLNFDFGLFKRFSFKERYALEFRWENFNVFNHTQLNSINGNTSATGTGANVGMGCVGGANFNAGDPSCTSTGFLVLDGSHDPRIMQFGLRFQF